MDFHLKQWRDEQEDELSDEQPAKFPRIQDNHHQQHPALPLFAPPPHDESPPPTKINYSYPDSKPPLPPTSSRFQSRFSMIQWQELELQALIFRHMVAGASVPPELLHLVKKSLVDSSSRYSYYQPSLLQAAAGYWGRGAMDPEPGRCRRTDGKKWRCSRDVVAGHKYCERHVHRGRNRSRKPVEFPVPATTTTTTHAGGGAGTQKSHHQSSAFGGLSGSLDIFQLNQGASSEPKPENSKLAFKSQHDTSGEGKYNGRVLRHFFDDWPRSDNTNEGAASQANPATNLSISTPVTNSSLDFLKLSTGNGEADPSRTVDGNQNSSVWSTDNHVAAVGGPLAEALRSSTGSSPTSVLNQIPRSLSDTSYVTARV